MGTFHDMSINERSVECTPDAVFDVLADGWLYATWVVGASRIRDVDGHWPQVGSKLHHSVGVWPLLLHDDTEVLEVAPSRLLRLQVRAWPAGEATVTLTLDPTPAGCLITMEEHATDGPAALIPAPVMDLLLHARNAETLDRLALLAVGRSTVNPTQSMG